MSALNERLKATEIKPLIGSKIGLSKNDLLSGEYASDIREALELRGALVFPEINLTDDEQIAFTKTLGNLAPEMAGELLYKVTLADGSRAPLDLSRLRTVVAEACAGLHDVDGERIIRDALNNMYDGIAEKDVPAFEQIVNEQGQHFLETLDDWLTARETEARKSHDEVVRVGVATYMFQREREQE